MLPGGPHELADDVASTGIDPVSLDHVRGRPDATLRSLVRLVRSGGFDLLHVHSDLDRRFGHTAALVTRKPVVGHLHAEWVHLGSLAPADAGPARRVSSAWKAAVRDRVERRVVHHYVAESARVAAIFDPLVHAPMTVLRQAVPTKRFEAARATAARGGGVRAELGLRREQPVLVNVSRMVDGKGQLDLVAAFAALASEWPDAVLLLAGDGPRAPDVAAAVRAAGLTDRVRLLGQRHDVPDVLAAGDVFVFASISEGFGYAVLEAMAARLPVVAYRLPALEEFAEHGRTALLVRSGKVDALADAIRSLLASPGLRAQLGASGEAVVRSRFPADAVARTFEGVYDAVHGVGARRV